jgi:branched-chain amino acid transport system substrate-binding protein
MGGSMNRRFIGRSLTGVTLAATLAVTGLTLQSGAAQKTQIVPIGVILNLTGAEGAFDAPALIGMKMAVQEINKTGINIKGTTYKFKLDVKNAQSSTSTVSPDAMQLAQDDHVKVLFGPIAGGALNAVPVAKADHLIYLSASSNISSAMGTSARLLFRPSIAEVYRDPIIAKATHGIEPSATSAAYLEGDFSDGHAYIPGIGAAMTKVGIKTSSTTYFDVTSTAFTPQITTIASQHPSILWGSFLDPADLTILQENINLSAAPVTEYLTFPLNELASTVPASYTGTVIVAETGPQLTKPDTAGAILFKKALIKFNGSLPAAAESTLYYYDALHMLAISMQKAGTVTNTDVIAKKMHSLNYVGAYGKERYNNIGQINYPIDVCTFVSQTLTCKSYS